MSDINQTRLKWVSSKDPKMLDLFCSKLPFKIEIKGNPVHDGKKWFLFFVLPEFEGVEFISRSLD